MSRSSVLSDSQWARGAVVATVGGSPGPPCRDDRRVFQASSNRGIGAGSPGGMSRRSSGRGRQCGCVAAIIAMTGRRIEYLPGCSPRRMMPTWSTGRCRQAPGEWSNIRATAAAWLAARASIASRGRSSTASSPLNNGRTREQRENAFSAVRRPPGHPVLNSRFRIAPLRRPYRPIVHESAFSRPMRRQSCHSPPGHMGQHQQSRKRNRVRVLSSTSG